MDLFWLKLVFLLTILVSGWGGDVLPPVSAARKTGGRLPSWGNAFSADIFFGIGLIHSALDILQDEFLRPGSRWAKWLSAALAVALMALLPRWV